LPILGIGLYYSWSGEEIKNIFLARFFLNAN